MSYEDNSRADSKRSIKSCPFCGGKPYVMFSFCKDGCFEVDVTCEECGVTKSNRKYIPNKSLINPSYLFTQVELDAINDWNRRPEDPQ